jgi:multimeric flavodoxin WrbA
VPTLLIVHHTPSPFMQAMFEAVVSGATDPEIQGVRVVRRAALAVSPTDVLEADGYLLGTPANLGYMSGALKHNLHGYRGTTFNTMSTGENVA